MSEKSHIFDPDMLETLLAIAETSSFTEAARTLNRSQSTISASIQRLEKAVGARLVNRTTRTVLLTADGEEMVRYARMVTQLSEQARRRFSQPNHAGAVRLGMFTSFGSFAMATVLREFHRLHPSVQVKVETDRSDVLLSRLRDGALDLVLTTVQQGHGFGAPIWQDELVWVGTAEIPRTLREPVPLAMRSNPSMLRRMGIGALHVAGRPHVIVFEASSLSSIAAAVDAGLGVGLFTRTLRPMYIPVIDQPGLLPSPGRIDVVLLRSEHDRRAEVNALHEIIRDLTPALFESAASCMFGVPVAPAPDATSIPLEIEERPTLIVIPASTASASEPLRQGLHTR